MKMVKKSLKKVVGGLKQPDFPMNTFEVFMNSRLLELLAVKREHEKNWGINRLVALVDSEFRIKFWRQAERVFDASKSRDEVKLDRAVGGMVKAYAALEAWAVENQVPQMPEILAVEHEMQDGSVMVVVGTHHDATLYQQFRPDVQNRHIWTMEELELIMESPVIKDTMKIKALMPCAAMVRLDKDAKEFPLGGATGFDDVKSDELEASSLPKVFDTSKMSKNRANRALEEI
tara:strand:- start:70 stop:765 length:696 start_codon:yes stop_codon:yes gene_type:complete